MTTAVQPPAARSLLDERKMGVRVLKPKTLKARNIDAKQSRPMIPSAGFDTSWTIHAATTT
jgi:hypothetical protein